MKASLVASSRCARRCESSPLVAVIGCAGVPPPRRRSPRSRRASTARWRCRRTGSTLFAINTPDNRLEIFDISAGTSSHVVLGRRRSRADRGGRPQQHRGLGGEPPLRQRQRRRRHDPADGRARRPHAARRRRAARHRLRRAGRQSRLHHHRASRVRTRRSTRRSRPSCATPGSRSRRRLGIRRDQPRRHAWRHAAHHGDALRRHAARARRSRPTAARSTPRSSTPAIAPPTLSEGVVPNGGEGAGGLPGADRPITTGRPRPEVGLIVRYDGTKWTDELGRNWNSIVKFALPDKDVFAIDANANPPIQLAGPSGFYTGVGTILFNMIANPVSGKVYVANLESINHVRFEGPGRLCRGLQAARRAGDRARPSRRESASPCSTAARCAAPSQQAHRLRDVLRRRSPTPRTTTASRSRSAWRSRATARRSTSRASARARSASTTRRSSRTTRSCRDAADQLSGDAAAVRPASCSTRRARSSTC